VSRESAPRGVRGLGVSTSNRQIRRRSCRAKFSSLDANHTARGTPVEGRRSVQRQGQRMARTSAQRQGQHSVFPSGRVVASVRPRISCSTRAVSLSPYRRGSAVVRSPHRGHRYDVLAAGIESGRHKRGHLKVPLTRTPAARKHLAGRRDIGMRARQSAYSYHGSPSGRPRRRP